MMSYIADYTGEIPAACSWRSRPTSGTTRAIRAQAAIPAATSTPEALPTQIPTTSTLSITTGLGQKANEDAEPQAQVEEYAAQGIRAHRGG
ncbi:MAG: hypothetical protein ACLVGA_13285 [Dysosmobacter sp.]